MNKLYIIKKILIFSITFSLSLGISISKASAYSSTLSNSTSNENITIINNQHYVINVTDSGKSYCIDVDKVSKCITFNGEKIIYNTNIELPIIENNNISTFLQRSQQNPTINKSSAANVNTKLPWKGSAIALSALLGAWLGGINVMGIASTVASVMTADSGTLTLKFTQYRSKEAYTSSYDGSHYNKCIDKNIRIYYGKKLVYGPKSGNWFAPVRP